MKRLYRFADFLKDYFLTGFVNSFTNNVEKVWQPFTEYPIGTTVTHTYEINGKRTKNKYVSVLGSKSGNQAPIHAKQGQVESDGGIRWMYLGESTIVDNGMFDMYLTLGRQNSWDGTDNPVTPAINQYVTRQCIQDIIYAKKIDKSSVAMVARRNTWKAEEKYEEFKKDKTTYKLPYYVTNKEGCVYYCLSNNNNQKSTIEPIGTSTQPIQLPDGYVWYFMAKIDIQNSKFLTDEFIPLNGDITFNPDMKNNRGGIATVTLVSPQKGQFANKNNIVIEYQQKGEGQDANLIPHLNTQGILEYMEVKNAGHDYAEETIIVLKERSPDAQGQGAELKAIMALDTLTGKTYIKDVEVLKGGEGYKQGSVSIHIEGDGQGAILEAKVSTAKGIISSVEVKEKGEGYSYATLYVVSGKNSAVGRVSLLPYSVSNPNILATIQDNAIMINVDLNPNETYFDYDSDYREVLLVVNLYDIDGNPANKPEYIGKAHKAWADPKSKLPKLNPEEGLILFRQTSNRLIRVAGQYEKVKLVISL
jgi:hypothetical protein|nr:MAG TPA: baseplate wedge protein [Caudoviricetes sp.]